MRIKLQWNNKANMWHMMLDDENNTFVQEFYNCQNMTFFPALDKDKVNYYDLKCEYIKQESVI